MTQHSSPDAMAVGAFSVWGTKQQLNALMMAAQLSGLWEHIADKRLVLHPTPCVVTDHPCAAWEALRQVAFRMGGRDVWKT